MTPSSVPSGVFSLGARVSLAMPTRSPLNSLRSVHRHLAAAPEAEASVTTKDAALLERAAAVLPSLTHLDTKSMPEGYSQFFSHGEGARVWDVDGKEYIDYKSIEELRRMLTPNGKIYTRKRLGADAREQRRIAQAVKRARYMGLLPYTSATL